jgi:membrane protein insertase Oxa1/YidC/SpoIIIJ
VFIFFKFFFKISLLLYNSVGTFWYILQQALFLRAKSQKISIGALFRGKILKFPHDGSLTVVEREYIKFLKSVGLLY